MRHYLELVAAMAALEMVGAMFPAAALAIDLVSLVLAFGWRSFAQWRRTGDAGLRLHAGPAGSVAWWAKLLFILALLSAWPDRSPPSQECHPCRPSTSTGSG